MPVEVCRKIWVEFDLWKKANLCGSIGEIEWAFFSFAVEPCQFACDPGRHLYKALVLFPILIQKTHILCVLEWKKMFDLS
jgi:hypothetical protein